MNKVCILIFTKFKVFSLGLKKILEEEKGLTVYISEKYEEVVPLCKKIKPQIIILYPDVGLIKQLNNFYPDGKIIIISDKIQDAIECVRLGIKGVIESEHSIYEMIKIIKLVHFGEVCISRKILSEASKIQLLPSLTRREIDVLHLIVEGKSNKEIARLLYLTEKTVKNHLSIIFQKLNVENRTQAAMTAIKSKCI